MKLALSCLAIYASCSSVLAANAYRMNVHIDPSSQTLEVSGSFAFTVPADETRAVTLYLNHVMQLKKAQCKECAGYTFDQAKTKAYFFAPDASALVLRFRQPLAKGHLVRFDFHYAGRPPTPPQLIDSVGPKWVELAMYSAWFPFQPDLGRFAFDLTVRIAKDWRVAGAGEVTSQGRGSWRLRQTVETSDINVVASQRLQSRIVEEGGRPVRIYYAGLEEAAADRIAHVCGASSRQFSRWFGPASGSGLTVVVAERSDGGGYGRPGYICLERAYTSRLDEKELSTQLPHEIAHMWWNRGPVTTWEDWLNESFAEYSSLMFARETLGQDIFDRRLAEYGKAIAKTPALRGMNRGDEQSYLALYWKGSVILNQLEKRMGKEQFIAFLARLNSDRVHSTDGLLELLEQTSSAATRRELEQMLAAPGALTVPAEASR